MRKLLAVLAGLMLAGSASATQTFTVKNAYSTNCGACLKSVNDSVGLGTGPWVVNINDGDYWIGSVGPTAGTENRYTIVPGASGTAATRITYIGNITTPANVRIFPLDYFAKSYITVKGVTYEDSLLSGDGGPNLQIGGGSLVVRDSFTSCAMPTGVVIYGPADSITLSSNTIGSHGPLATAGMRATLLLNGWESGPVRYPVITDNAAVFKTDLATDELWFAAGWKMFGSLGHGWPIESPVVARNVIESIRVTRGGCVQDPTPARAEGGFHARWYYVQHGTFNDNKITMYDSTGCTTNPGIGFQFRDKTRFNTFNRDTFLVANGPGPFYFSAQGSGSPTGDNRYNSCIFKSSQSGAESPETFFYQNGAVRDTFYRCSFLTNTGVRRFFDLYNTAKITGLYFDRCAFVSYGERLGGFNNITPTGDYTGPLSVKNSIFMTTNTAGALTAAAQTIYTPANVSFTSDYNVFYNAADTTGAYSWYLTNNNGSQLARTSVGPPGTGSMCGNFGQDCHSWHGFPFWTDSTYAGFNPKPVVGSPWIGRGEGGVTIGPTDPDSVDVTRPAPITDLVVTGQTASGGTIAWSVAGDDSLTGRAFSYEIRTSSAGVITAGNYASATIYTPNTLVPKASGDIEFFSFSGLNNNTTFYVAVKTYDEAGNVSAISNIVSFRTSSPPSSGIPFD